MDVETKPPGAPSEPAAEGMAARVAALDLVQASVARRGGFEEALARPSFTTLPPRERAFARALAGTTLRRLGALDAALDARLKSPPPEPVRWLLRLGAAQLLHMDVAAHAAVSVTVDQAAANQATRPYKGLVNAVLRGLARDGAPDAPPEVLAPLWLFRPLAHRLRRRDRPRDPPPPSLRNRRPTSPCATLPIPTSPHRSRPSRCRQAACGAR